MAAAVTGRHFQNLEREGLFKPVRLGASVRYLRRNFDDLWKRLADESPE